jgi:hypothetical protein
MRTITTARAALFIVGNLFAIPLYAQSHDHPVVTAVANADAPSAETKQAFALIKSLSGRWGGDFLNPETKKPVAMETSIRVASHGNSVVHEMKGAGDPEGSDKIDHPVTMIYLDGANLILTHFCDAGNRPRMSARISPDGKVVDFDFVDVAGPTTHGHMQHARFTFVDSNHHVEEWTWAMPNGKTMSVPLDLHRIETVATLPAK